MRYTTGRRRPLSEVRDDNARIDKEVWDTTGRMSKLRKQYSKIRMDFIAEMEHLFGQYERAGYADRKDRKDFDRLMTEIESDLQQGDSAMFKASNRVTMWWQNNLPFNF